MIAGIKIENVSRDLDHAPLRVICRDVICMLGLNIAYLCTKFGDSHFSLPVYLTTVAAAVPEIWLVPTKCK